MSNHLKISNSNNNCLTNNNHNDLNNNNNNNNKWQHISSVILRPRVMTWPVQNYARHTGRIIQLN